MGQPVSHHGLNDPVVDFCVHIRAVVNDVPYSKEQRVDVKTTGHSHTWLKNTCSAVCQRFGSFLFVNGGNGDLKRTGVTCRSQKEHVMSRVDVPFSK